MGTSIKKLYYSIGEVSEITGLKQYVLRYWESEFPSLSPSKNRAGNRVYKERDIQYIKLIKFLLYEKKFTIEGAKQKLKTIRVEDLERFDKTGSWEDQVESDAPSDEVVLVIRKIKEGLQEISDLLEE